VRKPPNVQHTQVAMYRAFVKHYRSIVCFLQMLKREGGINGKMASILLEDLDEE
jgi:hypothetical protein